MVMEILTKVNGLIIKDQENKEKLIELVKQEESLYNAGLGEHKDAIKTANIWKKISKSINKKTWTGKC